MFASQFDRDESSFRNRKNTIATIVTILVHALIILVLIFSILHTPTPPFEDNAGGMSVNFGTDAVGTGDEQPFTYNPGSSVANAAASQPAPVENAPEKVLTQENEDNNVTVPKAEDKPKPKVNDKAVFKKNHKPSNNTNTSTAASPTSTPVQLPQPDSKAMFSKGAYGTPNHSKGDGQGAGQGDQGNPNGDPNSKNYLGNGDGKGEGGGHGDLKGGAYLKGRKNTTLPTPNQCPSQGRVAITIRVDRNGKVTEAKLNPFKSTSVDDCNIQNALLAAQKATFNPDPNAPEIQEGTITYIYKVH
jgi:protein TonB